MTDIRSTAEDAPALRSLCELRVGSASHAGVAHVFATPTVISRVDTDDAWVCSLSDYCDFASTESDVLNLVYTRDCGVAQLDYRNVSIAIREFDAALYSATRTNKRRYGRK